MRFSLGTLLVLGTVGPPLLASAWFFLNRLDHLIANTKLDDWVPLFREAAALAAVIAVVTVAAALCLRSQTSNS